MTLKLGNGSFSPTLTPRGQCDCDLKQPNYSTFVKHSMVETGEVRPQCDKHGEMRCNASQELDLAGQ